MKNMDQQNFYLVPLPRKMYRTLRFIYRSFISKPKYLLLICLNPKKWCDHESYFPD